MKNSFSFSNSFLFCFLVLIILILFHSKDYFDDIRTNIKDIKIFEKDPELSLSPLILNYLVKNTSFWNDSSSNVVTKNINVVYAIVLPKRLDSFKKRLFPFWKEIRMLKAFDKDKIDFNYLSEIGFFKDYKIKGNEGRIACHLSHLACILNFYNSGFETALILEDDLVKPKENFLNQLDYIYEKSTFIYPDFNIIYYGYVLEPTKIKRNDDIQKHAEGDLWRLKFPRGRHGYLLTRNAARIILEKAAIMYHNGDEMYARLIKNKELISVGPRDQVFQQDRGHYGSELGNNNLGKIPDQFSYK